MKNNYINNYGLAYRHNGEKGKITMTNVNIYDDTADLLEKASEEKDISIAEIIDMLVQDYLEEI